MTKCTADNSADSTVQEISQTWFRLLWYAMQANNAAMAVFSPLDTNVIPGFQYNSAATPLSSFPQGGAKAALASWAKKPVEQAGSTPNATLTGMLACK